MFGLTSYKLPSGKIANSTGTYNDTVYYASGCDSVVTTLHLTVATVTPSVSIAADQTDVCAGTTVSFTATPVNGGTGAVYQWLLNGVNSGNTTNHYTNSNLANGDKISCVMTSNAACVTSAKATSNSITITVNAHIAPSVNIVPSINNICQGTPVTFTATPNNGGSAPVYQWQVNGSNAGTNSPTFSSSTLNNGDQVNCLVTSNAVCVTPASATSNIVTMTVNPLVTPAVSIAGVMQTSICPGSTVTFTATPTNGGSTPVYQWLVNGTNAGTNSPTFNTNTLSNGDVISCQLTSDAACLATPAAKSNNVTITVNPAVMPSASISVSENNVCAGTVVTFTATPVNGGSAPNYQWLVNGINIGSNSATFTSNSFVNGDVVSCVMTSNATCVTPVNATSNSISMNVIANVIPSVSIAASANNICTGTSVTFTATLNNGGSSPVYQWQVDGVNSGTNSPSFSSSTLNNGDQVSLFNNQQCRLRYACRRNQ